MIVSYLRDKMEIALITIKLPKELKVRLELECSLTDTTISQLLRKLIKDHIAKEDMNG
jgi:predicted DNA-binding protein